MRVTAPDGIHIHQGVLGPAREVLAQAVCPVDSPDSARKALLQAMVERHAGDAGKANRSLEQARRVPSVYPEDRKAIGHLFTTDPVYIPVVTGRVDLNFGWASNALIGSPADPGSAGKEASSPAGNLGLWLRLATPLEKEGGTGSRQWVHPTVELQAKASGYSNDIGRDYSYTLFGVRPAFLVGEGFPRGLFAYRYETALIKGGDRYDKGPLWFYIAHRGEFEFEPASGMTLFGGAGRREFREIGRSRTEVDGGAAGSIGFGKRMRLIGALTGRRYLADKAPYDLWGASALVSNDIRFAARWSLRTGFTATYDLYPRSARYFDASQAALNRRETTLKASTGLFAPPLAGRLLTGMTYEFSARFSNIKAYDYTDHRMFLKVAWNFSTTPALPSAQVPPGHLPLDYGLGTGPIDERLQDLLRQDEAMQRGSTCLD